MKIKKHLQNIPEMTLSSEKIPTMQNNKNNQKLKLIWDFRGPEGERTARHHAIHLKEYMDRKGLELDIAGFQQLNEMHSIAYIVVYRSEMEKVRDSLKPQRGQVYEEKS